MQFTFKINTKLLNSNQNNPSLFKLFKEQGYSCFYCGSKDFEDLTRDHLLPRMGKNGQRGNIVAACSTCNSQKSHKQPTIEQVFKAYQLYKKFNVPFIVEVKGGKKIKGGKKPLIRLIHNENSVTHLNGAYHA
jgi:hypothetical protein